MYFNRFVAPLLTGLLLLTGCGHVAAPLATFSTTPLAPAEQPSASNSRHVMSVGGVQRRLMYNVDRYQKQLAPKAVTVSLSATTTLPMTVDNRKYCSPIADQGQLGSCTAFAMGKGLREYLQVQKAGTFTAMSPLWLYYNERAHMGSTYINQDSGANISDGMWVLSNKGCAVESLWPYDITKFTVQPPAEADASAATYKVTNVKQLASFTDVKTALAAGKPVAFGFTVYSSFYNIGANGIMPVPRPGERVLGGHAVLAVGYDANTQYLVVRNSWGNGWGDKGYFYMPFKFAQDKTKAMEWSTAD